MIKKSDIQSITAVVAMVDVAIGPAIPANYRRYVLSIKTVNGFAGLNALAVGARENGAGASTMLWGTQGVLLGDMDADPDGPLTEEALPLFSIGGAGAVGASTLRGLATAGNFAVTVRYADLLQE